MTRFRLNRGRSTTGAVLAVAAILVLGGCGGGGMNGSATAAEPDVRKLDIGKFNAQPQKVEGTTGTDLGKGMEAGRMAGAVPPGAEVDPILKVGGGFTLLPTVDDTVKGAVAAVSKPVLENRKYVTGISAPSADRPVQPDGASASGATSLRLALLRFPDDDSAKNAAKELADADFAVSPENQKVTSDKFGAAHIHWRPNVPSMGAFLSKGQFVLSAIVIRPTTDRADLASWIDKVYTAWVPRVEKFKPVPASELSKTPLDGDGMLSRVLRDENAPAQPDIKSVGLVDPNAVAFGALDVAKWSGMVAETGIDKFARRGTNWLFRARDAAAATKAQGAIESGFTEWPERAESPKDLSAAVCKKLDARKPSNNNTYRCFVSYDRYIATLVANDLKEAQQKISAQYTLLVNSR